MRRGLAAAGIGAAIWFAAGIIGSGAMRLFGSGLLALPVIAWCWVHLSPARVSLRRELSATMVAVGTPLDVILDFRSARTASYVIVTDSVPASMGPAVTLCIEGVPAGAGRRAVYTLTPSQRGRFRIGPATIRVTDPFLIARSVSKNEHTDALIVTPAVERLTGFPSIGTRGATGSNATRRSRGTSEEFATIRPYRDGDDLRRVHWPSVARHGELMLRQDEARRSTGVSLFLETRSATLGRSGDAAFEQAVSAAASLGVHFQQGSALQVMTSELAPTVLSARDLLVALASVGHTESPSLGIERLGSSADPVVIVVLAPPSPDEVQTLIRTGHSAATRVACVILPPRATALGVKAAQRRASATAALRAASWTVVELDADASLAQRWNVRAHATSA